jgi:hypothetical protein
MALQLTQENGRIFRIIHRDCLPWILDNGLHCRNSETRDQNFKTIGNPDLIDKRASRIVPVPPGGVLSDYVPFYFTPHSIMMFNIHTGRSVPKIPNQEILILVSSLRRLAAHDIGFVFTDRHAYTRTAQYFVRMEDLDQVDWPLLQSRNFKIDPDDPGKQERYQAEALAWRCVPLDALQGLACSSPAVEAEIKNQIDERGLALKTGVQPNWYFQ